MVVLEMPVLDPEKCNGCGLCLSVCDCHALKLVGNVINVIETKECGWCTDCEAACPTGALTCPFEIVIEQHGK